MEKSFRLFGDLNKKQQVAVVIMAVTAAVYDFFYAHWISYRMALTHMETEIFMPQFVSVITAVALVIVLVIEAKKRSGKLALLRYALIIVLIAAVFASHFNGFCPACNEVKLVNGFEYQYV